MSRSRTATAPSAFGKWLDAQMKQADVQQKQVASRSGLGQSTIAGYLTGARNPNNAGIVHRIAQGILPEGVEETTALQVLHDGLLAAGFAAPPLSPMTVLVRDLLAQCEECAGLDFPQPQIDILVDEIEDYARHRLIRTAKHLRSQSQFQAQSDSGKQAQRQKQSVT